jgi:AraC-like DNA-binding protein
LHNVVGGVLVAHVLFIIAAGWKNDLVEPRRWLRGPILAATALYALAITVVQSGELFWRSAHALSPLAAVLLFAMSIAGVGVFLRADPDLFGPAQKPVEAVIGQPPVLAEQEAVWAATLDRLMREERLYRDEGLSIAALALKMRVPEYRLRRLINQRLGHRNFRAFLNQWRLDEAKRALADPAQVKVPISTIALDTGFQSLGPFNRAFKAETGITPSEYRVRETNLQRGIS